MNKITVCKTCGKEVATSAKTCPHCGAKLKKGKLKFIIGGIVGVLVLFILIGLFSSGSDNTANMNLVKKAHLGNYTNVTIGKMLQTNFKDGVVKWQAFQSDDNKNIVEADIKEANRKIIIQFIVNSDNSFAVSSFTLDGKTEEAMTAKETLDALYDNYAQISNDSATKAVDIDSSDTLKGTK